MSSLPPPTTAAPLPPSPPQSPQESGRQWPGKKVPAAISTDQQKHLERLIQLHHHHHHQQPTTQGTRSSFHLPSLSHRDAAVTASGRHSMHLPSSAASFGSSSNYVLETRYLDADKRYEFLHEMVHSTLAPLVTRLRHFYTHFLTPVYGKFPIFLLHILCYSILLFI
jgi:hypothetical protein